MRKIFVLLACLFGACLGGWTNPKCYEVWDIKLDLAKKSDFGKKDKGMGEAWFWLGITLPYKKENCHCIETIDCGDGETNLCALHKCASLKEPVSIFNPDDVQRFIVNLGGGGSNGGNSGQPLETK